MNHPNKSSAPDRSSWTIRKYRLGSEPGPDLSAVTTPAQRLEMIWPLTLEAWALAGKELPKYRRADIPIRKRPLACSPTD